MAMAAGGIVRMANGGQARIQGLMDILAVGGLTAPDLLAQGYTMDEINAAQNELRQRMTMPVIGADSILDAGQISDPVRTPQMGAGDQYDPPFIRGFTDVISDKASDLADAVRGGIESLGIEAQKQMPDYGLVGRNDLSLPSLPMPERRSQAEMGQMFSPEEVEERLSNRPSLVDDLDMNPMDFLRQRVFGGEPEPATDKSVQGESEIQSQPNKGTSVVDELTKPNPADFPTAPFPTSKPGLEPASPIDEMLEAAQQTQTDASDPRGRPDSDPLLDISDILDESRAMTRANMLMQLGAGITEGDLSGGLSRAGAAGMKGAQEQRALDMRMRLAKYQAGREDIARDEKTRQFEKTFGLSEQKLDALIEQNADLNTRARLKGLLELYEGALPDEKIRYATQIQALISSMGGNPAVVGGMQMGSRNSQDILAQYGLNN